MLAIYKYLQLNDNKSEETILRIYKRQWFDEYDNEEKQGLDKNESKIEDDKYIFFSSITFFFLPKKSQITH